MEFLIDFYQTSLIPFLTLGSKKFLENILSISLVANTTVILSFYTDYMSL